MFSLALLETTDIFTKSLEEALSKADAKIQDKNKELDYLNTLIVRKLFDLKDKFPELSAELTSLLKVLSLTTSKKVYFTSFEPLTETEGVSVVKKLKVFSKKNLGKKIKLAYRRVVQLCHPDKNSAKDLVEYFLSAKKFYELNDIESLLILEIQLKSFINIKSAKILLETLLKTMLTSKRQEIANLDAYI